MFTCSKCGYRFRSMPPPAETRDDDPFPLCHECIEEMLNSIEPISISAEEIELMVARATGR